MRAPYPQFSTRFVRGLGLLLGLAAGQLALGAAEEVAAAPNPRPKAVAAPMNGPEVYNAVCIACHSPPGAGGAPPFGDAEAWAPRIAHGIDTLIDHALHGFSGSAGIMPGKGGRLDLSDEEIIAAVHYMVEQATLQAAQ
ncbi:MAG: c-type cytochrome [Pseudomonadales bacterium]|jgi:cytochrome c5|nr:c-type cytochrome [Pseudomonadales bacterium]